MKNQEICYWNSSESIMEKQPKTYDGFMYESEAINSFNDLITLAEQIETDVNDIAARYKTLKGKYDEFTDFDRAMDHNSKQLSDFAARIRRYTYKCLTNAIEQIEYVAKKDKSFNDDLMKLSQQTNLFISDFR